MQIQLPVSDVQGCLLPLAQQAAAWRDLSWQLGVICLITGFTIGLLAMYLRYNYGSRK